MKKKHIILIPSLLALLIVSYLIFNFLNGENKEVLSKTKISRDFSTIIDKDNQIEIKYPTSEIFSYDIYKDTIYMSVAEDSKSKLGNKVIQYNIKTKEHSTLFTSKFESSSVQGINANGKWVTWIDADDFGGQINIYAMNIHTNKLIEITDTKNLNVDNNFPTLYEHYLSWVSYDKKEDKTYVMLRNLNEDINRKLYTLETYTSENLRVSIVNNKIIFSDQKNGVSYCYIYNVLDQTIQTYKIPYKNIGKVKLLNDHQFVYVRFYSDVYYENKVFLYDTNTKKSIAFSKEYMSAHSLVVDSQNYVYVGNGDLEIFEKYQVQDSTIKKLGKVKENDIFNIQANNDVYIIEKSPTKNKGTELIISKELP